MPPRRPPPLSLASLPSRPRAASPPPRQHPTEIVLVLPRTEEAQAHVWGPGEDVPVVAYLSLSSEQTPESLGGIRVSRIYPQTLDESPAPVKCASIAIAPLSEVLATDSQEARVLASLMKGGDYSASTLVIDLTSEGAVVPKESPLARRRIVFDTLLAEASREKADKAPRIVIANWGAMPDLLSTQMAVRNGALESWHSFVSALSLEPRTFLMLSPPPLPEQVPAGHGGPDVSEPAKNRKAALTELADRLAFVLPEALEVYGQDRLVWISETWGGAEGEYPTAGEWFELCRSRLARMAVGGDALDAIFARNAQTLFG